MFELKPYSRKELVSLYFPDSHSPKSACLSFRRLLDLSPQGTAVRIAILHRRHLTKAEVARIVDVLGEP